MPKYRVTLEYWSERAPEDEAENITSHLVSGGITMSGSLIDLKKELTYFSAVYLPVHNTPKRGDDVCMCEYYNWTHVGISETRQRGNHHHLNCPMWTATG